MMFWSMIEMGIAVIAGCLPTIWPLISKVSLENMVRTVRSVFSIESLRESLGRERSGADGAKLDGNSENSGPYMQFSDGIHNGTPRPSNSQSQFQDQERIVRLNRSVEVKSSPAGRNAQPENVALQDLNVRCHLREISSGMIARCKVLPKWRNKADDMACLPQGAHRVPIPEIPYLMYLSTHGI